MNDLLIFDEIFLLFLNNGIDLLTLLCLFVSFRGMKGWRGRGMEGWKGGGVEVRYRYRLGDWMMRMRSGANLGGFFYI